MDLWKALSLFAVSVVVAVALTAAGIAAPAAAQDPPRLPDEVRELMAELEGVSVVADDADVSPPQQRPDPGAPVNVLRAALADLDDLAAASTPRSERPLRSALRHLESGWQTFSAGSDDLSHLGATADALHRAQLDLAAAERLADRATQARIADLRSRLAGASARMAGAVLQRALAVQSQPGRLTAAQQRHRLAELALGRGDYALASAHFGGALKLAANTVKFDVALFEQNIKDALASQTVGHAFSIAFKGQLYQGGESAGLARTAADAPQTSQSPAKAMHVASVSKPLTTIVTLRALQAKGLTPDALVAPYLPGNWIRGAGVNSLTFRDFLTHQSGFGQIGAGSSYNDLRTAIATPVGSKSFSYSNANFGLMRVLLHRLIAGWDPAAFWPVLDPDNVTTATFLTVAQSLFSSVDVDVDCRSTDAAPTIQYNLPHGGLSGYLEPDRRKQCGGFGWFISSNDLAAVLANLRLSENLLSAPMRSAMESGFLGYMDPLNYGWIGGDFGTYYMHGGDWFHSSGEAHTCAVAFPIQVQVGLVINSERGAAMPYQCVVLQDAFDDAWVAN